MPDFLPDPLVSALLELSDPVPIEPGPPIEPPSGSPRRTGAALAAAALGVGIVLGAAAAPGPAPSTAASAYTIKVFGAGAGSSAPGDDAVASAAAPAASGLTDDALAAGSPASSGTTATPNDDSGTADGTGVPDDKSAAPPSSSGGSSAAGAPAAAAPPTGGGTTNPATPGPVWVITAGVIDLNDAIAHNSGLQTLAQTGVQLPDYTPEEGTELANGVALLAGKKPSESFSTADTLAGQLRSSNREWKAYVEDLGTACNSAAINEYDPNRNPFVHFASISPIDCVDRDVDITNLDSDLSNAATTPEFSWIVPDTTNDGTGPGGVADLETFLTTTINKIKATDAYKARGLILIVPDGSPSPGDPSGALLLSPSLTPATDSATYSPYSLLHGLQDRFGLQTPLAHAGDPTSSPTPIPSH